MRYWPKTDFGGLQPPVESHAQGVGVRTFHIILQKCSFYEFFWQICQFSSTTSIQSQTGYDKDN